MVDRGVDISVPRIKKDRWYQRPGKKLFPDNRDAHFLDKREIFLAEAIAADKDVLFDEDSINFDPSTYTATANGYFSLDKWEGVKGTTLLWSAKISNPHEYKNELKEKIEQAKMNVFLHGHSANPSVMRGAMEESGNDDVVSLSLGMMGTEGTVKDDNVKEEEWPKDQFLACMTKIGRDSDVLNISGHSMQGYTVLTMAADKVVRDRFSNAQFNALMPVVRGSKYDKRGDVHVFLHSGRLGALIQTLPLVDLLPKEFTRPAMEVANNVGIFPVVLGPIIREKVISLLHFLEVKRSPKYLKKSNYMLRNMKNLLEDDEIIDGLNEAVNEGRLSMVVGKRDKILNFEHMIELANRIKLVPIELEKDAHYPKTWKWLGQVLKKNSRD